MHEIKLTLKITNDMQGLRLDKALAVGFPDYSRARLQNLMQEGHVSENGVSVTSASQKVTAGQVFTIYIPPPEDPLPLAQDIPLNIVYEDQDLIVLNKEPDMVVHPAAGNYDGTLVNALLHYCGDDLSGVGGIKRPGIVHRLDKETSGLMVVAKNDQAHQHLSSQLAERTLSRVYHAFVWGVPQPRDGIIDTFMGRDPRDRKKRAVLLSGGKEAVTEYQTLKQFGTLATKVECRLQSGRTHQIRVHMAHIKHWLIGDPAYGRPHLNKFLRGRIHLTPELADQLQAFSRQALHAAALGFVHPRTGEDMHFTADYPDDMTVLERSLSRLNVTVKG